MSPTRFVILHHRQRDGEHWDLMIEQPATLATWQLLVDPTTPPDGNPIPARRIADHRKTYLAYEGPISRGRGEVRRVDSGTCEILSAGAAGWRLKLVGKLLRGLYAIHKPDPQDKIRDSHLFWFTPISDCP